MTEELPSREDVAAILEGEQQTRTVAAERDLPRIREWVGQAISHSVNEAAQTFGSIRYWLDLKQAEVTEWMKDHNPECECEVGETWLEAIAAFRALLPESPASGEHGGEDGDARHESDPAGRRPGHVTDP